MASVHGSLTGAYKPSFLALAISLSVLYLVIFTPVLFVSDQNSHYPLVNQALRALAFSSTILTYFLGAIHLLLRFAKPVSAISERLSTATLFASCATLILGILFVLNMVVFSWPLLGVPLTTSNLNELLHWRVGWAIESGLIYFAIAMLYKLINWKFPSRCHLRCLNVSFLTLCIAFSGLYTDPLSYLPGTTNYNSIIHRTDHIYHSILVPITFLLGTILLILGVAPTPPDLVLPFVSIISKEDLTVSTLAVGLTTLLIGVSLLISPAFGYLAMAGDFGAGGPGGAICWSDVAARDA